MNKVERILKAIRSDLLPLTRIGVSFGNHVFGGMVLRADTLEKVIVGTNKRVYNPIFHGEISTILRFFELNKRPNPEDCIFVASHEPCSMCISAIAWSGFKEIWVLFDYEDVAKDFNMPVDLMMYKEIFGTDGANPRNMFFRKFSIKHEARKEENAAELEAMIQDLESEYAKLKVRDFDYPGM